MDLGNRLKLGLLFFLIVFLIGTVSFRLVGPEGTPGDLDIGRKTGLVVLAIRDPVSDSFHFAPGPDTKIKEGMSFVVLGNAECLPDLQSLLE